MTACCGHVATRQPCNFSVCRRAGADGKVAPTQGITMQDWRRLLLEVLLSGRRILFPGIGVLSLAALVSGCITTRPLASLPEVKRFPIAVESTSKTNLHVVCLTARGRNAKQAGATGGLIGMLVAAGVGAGEESRGKEEVKRLHAGSGGTEVQRVTEEITNSLIRSGIQLSADGNAPTKLLINVESVGLQEVQRRFWVACVRVTARLRKPDAGESWSACASSTGTKLRRVEEFTADPGLYREDFWEAAEDVARQLVVGPIRR
jgi:hypothetical protein